MLFCRKFASAILMAMSAFVIGSSAMAQEKPVVVSRFDNSTIPHLLRDVQTTWTVEQGADGQAIYRVKADGGVAFTVTPRACSAERRCVGLLLIAVFTRGDGRTLADLDNFLSNYNDNNPNGKVYRVQDGEAVVLQGYINAANGIRYANAQAQLLVFGQELAKIRAQLTEFGKN